MPDDWQSYRQQVIEAAVGHYPALLPALGVPSERLRNVGGPCPGCGGTDRFRFDDKGGRGTFFCSQGGGDPVAGDGIELLRHVHGWSFIEAIDAIADQLAIARPGEAGATKPAAQPAPRMSVVESPGTNDRALRALRRAWAESTPVDWSTPNPVTRYLRKRGLAGVPESPPADLRLHSAMGYWHGGELLGRFPTMLAVLRGPSGEPVQLHRTYLTPDGEKAPVPKAKKLMSSPTPGASRGSAVRLYPAGKTLDLAEGIETALAVHVALSRPVWACVSEGGLRRVRVPADVASVQVWADHDPGGAGQSAGALLVQRLRAEGRRADLYLPDQPGRDWLDVLTEDGQT